MKHYWLALMCVASFGFAQQPVCLQIDQGSARSTQEHPLMAVDQDDFSQTFFVQHGTVACFNAQRRYYLMMFLGENESTTVYGTVCAYSPVLLDAGKKLIIEGENGDSPCRLVGQEGIESSF